ncbi:MAG: hypothetical protein EBX50_10065 [Chitinophagia bacterium]|jgi:hypothetical protein|nr:hypothetical protein [Chitinophagia bacterium]
MKFRYIKAYFLLLLLIVLWEYPFAYSMEINRLYDSNIFFETNVLGGKTDTTGALKLITDTLQKNISSLQKDNADLRGKLEAVNKNLEELKLQVALLGSPVHAILQENIKLKTDSIQRLSMINQDLSAKWKQEQEKNSGFLAKSSQDKKSLDSLSDQNKQYKTFISQAIDEILGIGDSMVGSKLNIDPYKGILQPTQIKKWDSRTAFKLRFDPLLRVMHKTELSASDLTSIKVLMNDYRNNTDFQIMHPQLYRHLVILNFWQRQFFKREERLIVDLNNAPKEPISSRQEYLQRKIDATDYLEFPSLEFAIKSAMKDVNYNYIPVKK